MRPFKEANIKTTHEPTTGTVTISASMPENVVHLLDTYDSMKFRELLIKMLAGRFVKENYHRLMKGIIFEELEEDLHKMVRQKFAEMLDLKPQEPKKPDPVYIKRYGSGASGG